MDKNFRNQRLTVRFTSSELEQVKSKFGGNSLSTKIRDFLLTSKVRKKPQAQTIQADPQLLFELNAIGRNLNQLTRIAHQHKQNGLELAVFLDELAQIKTALERLKP